MNYIYSSHPHTKMYLVATRVISEDEEVFVDYNYNTVAELVQKADTECKGAS